MARIKIGVIEPEWGQFREYSGEFDKFYRDVNGHCLGASNVLYYEPIIEIARKVPIHTKLGVHYASVNEIVVKLGYDGSGGCGDLPHHYFMQTAYYNSKRSRTIMKNRLFSVLAIALLPALGACGITTVNTNEECLQLRMGKVINERLDPGFKTFIISNTQCFDITEQNFPSEDSGEESITMEAQTSDPLTVVGDVTVVYKIPAGKGMAIYETKGSENALESELYSAIREGYRNGVAQYTMVRLFGPERANLDDLIKDFIQEKIGREGLIEVKSVYVRNIRAPEAIEAARIEASRRDQLLEQERKQFQVDSIAALRRVVNARAFADSVSLEGNAYAENPALLELRATQALAEGISRVCNGTTTCIVGGNVLDQFLSQFRTGN